ncbi:leucyl-tRNA synthetase [Catenulispora sp. EB89]|uniref:leucine--tRNA ligase n=1 Tax=Catenulispora sp. EB89 TaxID=3156257 RepID=UPI00351835A5
MSEQTDTQPKPASDEPKFRYTASVAADIEPKWQEYWAGHHTFEVPDHPADTAEPKAYILDMFPYPSGAGLHVGHPLGYIATDVLGRYKMMTGHKVLHTIGFDAFGLAAEQYAVEHGIHPRVSTEANIARYKEQIHRIGFGHDTRRGVSTIDVSFYKWTQWIFLQIFNSWYDDQADKARPISLLIEQFADGARRTPDGRAWSALSAQEQAAIIDSHRLAYIAEAPVNWCPGLGTVLSNEEVTADGRSERGNFPVFKRNLRQWMMRITKYGDRLLADLDRLDWPEPIKLQQRNWIGRSEGARVHFGVTAVDGSQKTIEIFTTRPDTLFGATYMVLAPEHELVDSFVAKEWPAGTREKWTGGHATPAEAVAAYRAAAAAKSEVERQTEGRQKTGVFTGTFAVNPVNGEGVPVFIADYVLMGYGTGAIMAVPAHDQRDFEFARAFDLPMQIVVAPPVGWPEDVADWTEAYDSKTAQITNSANDEVSLEGLPVPAAIRAITEWLQAKGIGEGTVTYRLRDWLFSRQRYWGEPFPIVYAVDGPEAGIARALPESMLPLELPEVEDFSPKTFEAGDVTSAPEPPLARATEWVNVTLDLGDGPRQYHRETNTMPQWAGSCWYYLRYLSPTDDTRFVDAAAEKYWMGPQDDEDTGGVDLYVGGAEHAVLHLLYARFWHKVLFDLDQVTSAEPFRKLYNQGMIQGSIYRDARGIPVEAAQVEDDGEGTYTFHGEPVTREFGKIGKSLKNVISPDDMIDEYSADTLRVYEMSMGPLDMSKPWDTRASIGSFRFLQRLWRNVIDEETGEVTVVDAEPDEATLRAVHKTIDGARADMEGMRFNTAISKLIELNNHLTRLPEVPRPAAEALVVLTAPFAPHIAEELWSRLGHDGSVAHAVYPVADPAYLVDETVTCVVQVAGKVKDRLEVPPGIDQDALRELALASEGVQRALEGRGVRTVIVRAPKLVNVVPA